MMMSVLGRQSLRAAMIVLSSNSRKSEIQRTLCASHHQRHVLAQLVSCLSAANKILKMQNCIRSGGQKNMLSTSMTVLKSRNEENFMPGEPQNHLVPEEWTVPFELPEPDLDWKYLLDKKNTTTIAENIKNRKGIGDIHKVLSLFDELSQEQNEERRKDLRQQLIKEALNIPNTCHPNTIIGDESMAQEIERVGVKKEYDFKPRAVLELGEKGLKMLRVQNLTFSAGSKTYYLEGDLARLENALVAYTLDHLIAKGFELVSVPEIVHSGVIEGCGFSTSIGNSQVYHIHPECLPGTCLAGTAEMPLAGYFMNEELPYEHLPQRLAAVSRCYRAEATEKVVEKGLYRVHHFTKVEMFGVTSCNDHTESDRLLSEFLDIERELFADLGLHFRILDMPSQELGAPAHKKYDIEAWMPGKEIWGEVSSCSNCTDFQARRLNIRYRSPSGQLQHVHTVNGTACAVPRMIICILEQNQGQRRKVELPEVLWPYMKGQTHLENHRNKLPYTYIKTLRHVSKPPH